VGRDGDKAQFGAGGGDDSGHQLGGVDIQAVHAQADLRGIGVEKRDDAEAPLGESLVTKQSAGQIADADDRDAPNAVNAEGAADSGDQFGSGVANARLAKIAEEGEILADLDIGDAKGLAKLVAGDFGDALALEALEAA